MLTFHLFLKIYNTISKQLYNNILSYVINDTNSNTKENLIPVQKVNFHEETPHRIYVRHTQSV